MHPTIFVAFAETNSNLEFIRVTHAPTLWRGSRGRVTCTPQKKIVHWQFSTITVLPFMGK
jgi:hypothetical protein